ncbi:MAG: TonB family protein [Aliishimia sp.]
MIRSSPLAKGLALTVSATLLISGMQLARPEAKVEMEGGGVPVEARIGTAFEDMAVGTLTAQVPDDAPQEPEPPVETEQHTDVQETEQPNVEATLQPSPQQTPLSATNVPSPTAQPVATDSPLPKEIPTLVPMQVTPSADAVLPSVTAQKPTQITKPLKAQPAQVVETTLTPVAPQAVQPTETQTEPNQTIASLTPETSAPSFSTRPKRRDAAKAAKIAAARPKPVEDLVVAKKPKPKADRGNAKRNNTQGAENGTNQQAKAKTQGNGKTVTAQAGNAAISNYPGKVMRKIMRVRKPNVRARGAAIVAFRVAANGGLARVSITRSSDSNALDQAALRVIKSAAPFPAPPAGAQRAFSVTIKGR